MMYARGKSYRNITYALKGAFGMERPAACRVNLLQTKDGILNGFSSENLFRENEKTAP